MSARLARLFALAGVAGLVALYVVGLGRPLSNYEEPLVAEFVRSMHEDGDYVTLRYQGAVTRSRPATSVALMAGASALVDGERGLRLVPMACTLLAALLAGAVVQRRYRRWSATAATVALAAGVPSAFVYGRLALVDPPFVACTVAAVAAAAAAQRRPRYVVWSAGFLGAGALFKSVPGALPAVVVVPWLVAAWRHHGRAARPLVALAVGLGAAAPLFAAGFAIHGAAFWHEHVLPLLPGGGARPGALEAFARLDGPLAYLEHLWFADRPLAALLFVGAPIGAAALAVRDGDRELGVLASAALGMLVLLSARSVRTASDLLVFYPLAAMSAGALAARLLVLVPGRPRAYDALVVALAITFVMVGAVNQRFDPAAVPCVPCADLGRVADSQLEPGGSIYSLDWYAPALSPYAGRPWRMLNTDAEVARLIRSVDPFDRADNVEMAPPWPLWPVAIAGPAERIRGAGLQDAVVARSNNYLLAVIEKPRRWPRWMDVPPWALDRDDDGSGTDGAGP